MAKEESGKDLADKIRNSIHLGSKFFGDRNLRLGGSKTEDELSDDQVIQALVEARVEDTDIILAY